MMKKIKRVIYSFPIFIYLFIYLDGFYIHKSISLSHNYKVGDNMKLIIPINNLNYLIQPNINLDNETYIYF